MNEEQTIRDAIATLEADGFRVVWGRYGSGFADDGRIIVLQGAEGCCPMTAVARVSPECGNSVLGTAANYLKVSPEWCVGFVTGWDHPNAPIKPNTVHPRGAQAYAAGAELDAKMSKEYSNETTV